jgi:solute carrier family 35 protein F5
LPFFIGQYSYQQALSLTSAPVVNILSSTSGLFTLILSAIFPSQSSDRFSVMKFLFVIVSIGGTVLISISEMHESADDSPQSGAAWALGKPVKQKRVLFFFSPYFPRSGVKKSSP